MKSKCNAMQCCDLCSMSHLLLKNGKATRKKPKFIHSGQTTVDSGIVTCYEPNLIQLCIYSVASSRYFGLFLDNVPKKIKKVDSQIFRRIFQPSNCIGRKELSYVHIKPDAMTRAMTFSKGLSESEVVY